MKLIAVAALSLSLSLSLSTMFVSGCSPAQNPSSRPGTTPGIQSGSPSAPATSPAPHVEKLEAHLKTPDGKLVANATLSFSGGYAMVTVETVTPGMLAPGFHEMHIHEIGKCEPDSVAPTGGPRGNFLSAGEHYQAPGHNGMPASGDLTSLEVRQDGSAYLMTTTDAFTRDQLLAGAATALMLHGAQYGDQAMERIACGVIGPG